MDDTQKDTKQEWAAELMKTHQAPLTRYSFSITRSLEAAEDIVQDTFLKLCQQQRQEIDPKVIPWLFRVCRNASLDWYRKERKMNPLSESITRDASPHPSPAEAASAGEAQSLVLRYVEMLPENQREVIRLKFQGGLSYKKIAEITDLSVTNVGFILHTALQKLRDTITRETDLMTEKGA